MYKIRMNKIKIIVFAGIFGIIAFFPFQGVEKIQAGTGQNVFGYAWSENIGWISFNSISGGGSANYGVNIDVDGTFFGYAWSENIGWISFNESDLTGCPIAPCRAWVDISCPSGQCPIYGWVRVLAGGTSESGGWDGWIKLRGSNYGLYINKDTGEFHNWAWGGNETDSGWRDKAVSGWLSFNCAEGGELGGNICGQSDYRVTTALAFNYPPVAAFLFDPSSAVYNTEPLILVNKSTDLDGLGDIVLSRWDILNWGSSPDSDCCSSECDFSNPMCNYPPQFLSANNYTVNLYIEDSAGDSSSVNHNFSILQDAIAGFQCSIDNVIWQVCEVITPEVGQEIYLKDDPSLVEHSTVSQGANVITHRRWSIVSEAPFSDSNDPNPMLRVNELETIIELMVTDNVGRTAERVHIVNAVLPLPEWTEIRPE